MKSAQKKKLQSPLQKYRERAVRGMSFRSFTPKRQRPAFAVDETCSMGCDATSQRGSHGQWTSRLTLNGTGTVLTVQNGDICVRRGGVRFGCDKDAEISTLRVFCDWQSFAPQVAAQDCSTASLEQVYHARYWRLNSSVTVDINLDVRLSPEHGVVSFTLTLPQECTDVCRTARSTIVLERRDIDGLARSAANCNIVGSLIVAATPMGALLHIFAPQLTEGLWNCAGQVQYEIGAQS